MNHKKVIDLILDNPANRLTTTSKSLLKTLKLNLSLNKLTKAESKLLQSLIVEAVKKVTDKRLNMLANIEHKLNLTEIIS